MKKTLFRKYLTITTAVILISFAVISGTILIFVTNYWRNEKRSLLQKSAENVAEIAANQAMPIDSSRYLLVANTMQGFIKTFASNIESDIFITDVSGNPILTVYGSRGGNVDASKPVSDTIMQKTLSGHYSAEGTMDGKYDTSYYIVGVPIIIRTTSGNLSIGAVFAAYNVDTFNSFRWAIVTVLLWALLAAFAVSFALVWLFTYRLVKPLRNMAAAAHSFGEGNFSVRVPVAGDDEIGQLSAAFNSMADSLSASESSSRSFIANVSHELKTPMTTIAGFIDGILDGTIPPEKEKYYLSIVSQEVKRLSRLVRTMLDLSRIDSGALKLRPSKFDITNTILVSLISFEQKIEEKKLEVSGMEDTDSLWVEGDPDMLHQVIYNLIDNAVKFTNEGGTLRVTVSQSDGRTTVAVENSGPGIAPDELPMVFERFYKTDKSRSQDKNGMGLGLYIVRTIVRLHGGEITASSEQNVRTRFEFWVPDKMQKPHDRRLVETTAESADEKPAKK